MLPGGSVSPQEPEGTQQCGGVGCEPGGFLGQVLPASLPRAPAPTRLAPMPRAPNPIPILLLSLEGKRVPACSAPGSSLRPSVTTLLCTQGRIEGQQSGCGSSARHSCGLRPTWSVQALVSIQRQVRGCHGPSPSDLGPPGRLVPLPRPCCAFLSGLGEGWGEAGWRLKGVPGLAGGSELQRSVWGPQGSSVGSSPPRPGAGAALGLPLKGEPAPLSDSEPLVPAPLGTRLPGRKGSGQPGWACLLRPRGWFGARSQGRRRMLG